MRDNKTKQWKMDGVWVPYGLGARRQVPVGCLQLVEFRSYSTDAEPWIWRNHKYGEPTINYTQI